MIKLDTFIVSGDQMHHLLDDKEKKIFQNACKVLTNYHV